MRVLIVEDDTEQRELLAILCRSEGCEAVEAEDGRVGAELFAAAEKDGKPFRLVILDLAMPVMDGATAAKRMREAEGERRAHIEGCTGYPEHVESVETFIRAGIDHLSEKPVELPKWKSLIHSLIKT